MFIYCDRIYKILKHIFHTVAYMEDLKKCNTKTLNKDNYRHRDQIINTIRSHICLVVNR